MTIKNGSDQIRKRDKMMFSSDKNKRIRIDKETCHDDDFVISLFRRGEYGPVDFDENEIYIEESCVHDLLGEFLDKYYDHSIPENAEHSNKDIYEPNGENLYTIDNAKKMLADIRRLSVNLKTDYDSVPTSVTDRFYNHIRDDDKPDRKDILVMRKYIKDNVKWIIDFYDKVAIELEKMIENSYGLGEDHFIIFAGP